MAEHKKLATPNAKSSYEISKDEVPVHCPMPGDSLWNSHPRIFIAFDKNGNGKCKYCGASFHLK